ncbi:glutathione S-transferase 1-1-like [Culicoides brevitarsis]|uniref:glutathione S-transferase 1-1-like n=1 Tax=Culicoides brevitarsis TaxID=469753 RepID=UPI00307BDDAC
MPCTLYYLPEGPPSRAVILLIKYLELNDIQLKVCSPITGDTSDPEFVKMNPQKTVPFLDDNGFYLSESRAIMMYLIHSRKPECNLLGRFPKKIGLIQQRMHFEMGSISGMAALIIRPVLFGETTVPPAAPTEKVYNSLAIVDGFLAKTAFIADNVVTIADFCYLAIIASFVHCGMPIEEKFPNIWKWYQKCKNLPGYDMNEEASMRLGDMFKSKLTEGF